MEKRWLLYHQDGLFEALSAALNVSDVTARILINRGLLTEDAARKFLNPTLDSLDSPHLLKDMDKAVTRLSDAIANGEKITVYGDYDVDGTTATVLLLHFLRLLGAECDYYIPDRLKEGYGLNREAIDCLAAAGTKLLVTVDNGISAFEEVKHANSLGLDMIVTDHHQIPEKIPPALAVINPQREECGYPTKETAGVGLAFNLIMALRAALREKGFWKAGEEPNIKRYLDLVALGTVADMAPLVGVNRTFVTHGLKELSLGKRVGISALKEVSGNQGEVGVGVVGFQIAPRLNAAGRLSTADSGVKLLMTEDKKEAVSLARLLDDENKERREIEKRILEEAVEQVEKRGLQKKSSIVLADKRWHPGVIGIVASRIVERYYRPTVLLAVVDGVAKGSARSIEGFHLYDGIKRCASHLLQFGGHKYAAGLSMNPDSVKDFETAFEKVANATIAPDDLIPPLKIDVELPFESIEDALVEEFERLAPFGLANAEPVFLTKSAEVVSTKILKEAHLKLRLGQKGREFDAIAFNRTDHLNPGERVSIVFSASFNVWKGRRSIQLKIKDIKKDSDFQVEEIRVAS